MNSETTQPRRPDSLSPKARDRFACVAYLAGAQTATKVEQMGRDLMAGDQRRIADQWRGTPLATRLVLQPPASDELPPDGNSTLSLFRGRWWRLGGKGRGAGPTSAAITYRAIPGLSAPKWFLPRGRAAARASRGFIKPSRFPSRVAWRLYRILETFGLGWVVFPDEVRTRHAEGFEGIFDRLARDLLSVREPTILLYTGAPGVGSKVTVLIADSEGRAQGYVKLAADDRREALAREYSALRALADSGLRDLRVPEAVHFGRLSETAESVLVTRPVDGRIDPRRARLETPHVAALVELAGSGPRRGAQVQQLVDGLTERFGVLHGSRLPGTTHDPVVVLGRLRDELVRGSLQLCPSHGDFSPWNVAIDEGMGLWVFDWEEWGYRPYLWDLFFYVFQYEFGVRRTRGRAVHHAVRGRGGKYRGRILRYLSDTGAQECEDTLWRWFLLDLGTRYAAQAVVDVVSGDGESGAVHFAVGALELADLTLGEEA